MPDNVSSSKSPKEATASSGNPPHFNRTNIFKRLGSPHPSLTLRASVACATAVVAFSLLASAAIFAVSFFEAQSSQDERLEEVAGIISRSRTAFNRREPNFDALYMDDVDFERRYIMPRNDPRAVIPEGTDVIIQTLHKTGRSLRLRLDKPLHDGFHTIDVHGTPYRIFSLTLNHKRHVITGERISSIWKEAWADSINLLLPFLVLSVLLSVGIWLLLWRMMSPVKRLADEICGQSAAADVIPGPAATSPDMPSEFVPLICAFNGLVERIESLRAEEARFVADAAHELRSPLAALSLQAERLEKEDLSPSARTQLATLRGGINRAVRQVSQLLTLKRAQAGAPLSSGKKSEASTQKSAKVLDAVSEAVQSVYWEAEKLGITIEVSGIEEAETLPANKAPVLPIAFDNLFTILRNLLENAVRYSPKGSTVTLRLDTPENPVLTVIDHGPGIPLEDREKVLKPFYRRLGTGVAGTGLGLAIVKTLCDRSGLELTLTETAPNEAMPGLSASIYASSSATPYSASC